MYETRASSYVAIPDAAPEVSTVMTDIKAVGPAPAPPATAADSQPTGRLVPVTNNPIATRNPYSTPGGYGNGMGESGGGFLPDLLEYWRIVTKRKWMILSILGSCLALGVLITLIQTPLYSSTVRLQIDRYSSKVVEGGNVSPVESADIDFLKTQYELLLSRTMAERVVSTLKLGDDSEFLRSRGSGAMVGKLLIMLGLSSAPPPADKRALDRQATGLVMEGRQVRGLAGSRLVDVITTDPSPARASAMANAYADSFVASTIDKRFEANAYAKTFLDDQSRQLKLRLEESEKILLQFAEREQIIVVNEKSSIAENNLAAANSALGIVISERTRNEQIWKQVEPSTSLDLPQFLNNAVIAGLRASRNTLVSDYQEKLQTFKPAYPMMMEINNKVKEIDRQLAAETKSIKAALKGAYENSAKQEEETRKQIDKLREEVLDLQKRSIQYNSLKREVDTNRSLYNSLLQRFKEVDIAGGVGTNNVFIVDRAVQSGTPSSPIMARSLLVSLFLGLLAGLGSAYLLEVLDDTVRSAEEIERISGLTTLGVIPKVPANTTTEAEIADPRSAMSESYRSLATSLQFTTDTGLPKTMVITSSGPSEGKSITSLAIARHFATVGLKVLLIDADLRKPSLHTKMALDNSKGLSNFLTGACTPPEAMQPTSLANLTFMASGPLPPNAADLLGSPRLLSLLTVGLEVYDLIILDGPPVMGMADAQLLSSAASATVFVVGSGQARMGGVRVALKRLEMARAPIIGTVLTKFDSKLAAYGDGYGYGVGYGYGGGQYGGAPVTPVTPVTTGAGPGQAGAPQLANAKEAANG
jgi:polysaccharide biosynthesis transport protein